MQLPDPEHVSDEALKRCREALREPFIKAFFRWMLKYLKATSRMVLSEG